MGEPSKVVYRMIVFYISLLSVDSEDEPLHVTVSNTCRSLVNLLELVPSVYYSFF